MKKNCTCGHEYGPEDEKRRQIIFVGNSGKECEYYICKNCKKESNFHLTGNESFGVSQPLKSPQFFAKK